MNRTTLALPSDLLRALKTRAAQEGIAMKDLAARLLRDGLGAKPAAGKFRFRVSRAKGKGVLPGIDLADRNSYWDKMGGRG